MRRRHRRGCVLPGLRPSRFHLRSDPRRRRRLRGVRQRVPAEEEDPLDVASDSSRREAAERVLEITGADLSAVLHHAGPTTTGFFEDLSGEPCRHILETHLIGAMDLTRRLLSAVRNNGSGRIEVISSNAVNVPHPMFSVCAAATVLRGGRQHGTACHGELLAGQEGGQGHHGVAGAQADTGPR
ncbi:SDR family NAD(P)-dependent oxidoreductase [Streptomyces sp. WAC05858]|nr:SDR family NAD(P)-dependent oxidoreductase [Streptomyces sp. WAC05858]